MALALPRFFATFGIGRSLTILKKFAAGAGLARGLLVYDFGVQLFRDEASMPIEDASVERGGGPLRHRRAANHPEAGRALAARAEAERLRGDAVLRPVARAGGTPTARRHDRNAQRF
jgi:hypothetical protein